MARKSTVTKPAAKHRPSLAFVHRPAVGARTRFAPFSSQKVVLSLTTNTKAAPSDVSTPSLASVYYTPSPAPKRTSQCWLCLGIHTVCRLVPKADRDCLIQVRKRRFLSRQAKRQRQSPRSRSSQSPATDISTAAVFNTEEQLPSTNATVGPIPGASKPKKTRGRVEATRSTAPLPNRLFEPGKIEATRFQIPPNDM